MVRIRLLLGITLLVSSSLLLSANVSAAAPELRAVYAGHSIPLLQVSTLHCHDGAYPIIRCFATEAEATADANRIIGRAPGIGLGTGGQASIQATFYVTFYQDENYGGASWSTTGAISDLSQIGWNDAITSFKSLNGGHPKWWTDSNYSAASAQWAAGAWVANIGSNWNDQFSSVKNVP